MNIRVSPIGLLSGLLVSIIITAQVREQKSPPPHSCPGGFVSPILETIVPTSLEQMILGADLIVVGTVVNTLPAFQRNPPRTDAIETDSVISVTERLAGTLPPGINRIVLFQIGGTVGNCTEIVQDDPLVKLGEEFVLFLWPDDRKQVPNTSGLPRYGAFGVWSGKVKVVNGSIHFLPRATKGLHDYDNIGASAFIARVKDRIKTISPAK